MFFNQHSDFVFTDFIPNESPVRFRIDCAHWLQDPTGLRWMCRSTLCICHGLIGIRYVYKIYRYSIVAGCLYVNIYSKLYSTLFQWPLFSWLVMGWIVFLAGRTARSMIGWVFWFHNKESLILCSCGHEYDTNPNNALFMETHTDESSTCLSGVVRGRERLSHRPLLTQTFKIVLN